MGQISGKFIPGEMSGWDRLDTIVTSSWVADLPAITKGVQPSASTYVQISERVYGDHPLLSAAKCNRLAGGWQSACGSSSRRVGATGAGQRLLPVRSAGAPPPAGTRPLYRGGGGACPLHASPPPNAPPGSTPPLLARFRQMPGPPMVSGGNGDLGSCLMSVEPASRRGKELDTDAGGGGIVSEGTEDRTGGTDNGKDAVLLFNELQRQTDKTHHVEVYRFHMEDNDNLSNCYSLKLRDGYKYSTRVDKMDRDTYVSLDFLT